MAANVACDQHDTKTFLEYQAVCLLKKYAEKHVGRLSEQNSQPVVQQSPHHQPAVQQPQKEGIGSNTADDNELLIQSN